MNDWFITDAIGLMIFGGALLTIWLSANTSVASALVIAAAMIVPAYSYAAVKSVTFNGTTFPGQFPLTFVCVALATVYARMGGLAAHRVWRSASVASVFTFMIVSWFLLDDNRVVGDLTTFYADQIHVRSRVFYSVIIQVVFIGGIAQVFWRTELISDWMKYVLTAFGFPFGSMVHSLVSFYGAVPDFWETAFRASMGSLYLGVAQLVVLLAIIRYTKPIDPDHLVMRSARELLHIERGTPWLLNSRPPTKS